MPSQEDITTQQKLLETNRKTLQIFLQQRDQLGSAYVPPGIVIGILEARANILRIKINLRQWDVFIEDMPDDSEEEFLDSLNIMLKRLKRARSLKMLGLFAIILFCLIVFIIAVPEFRNIIGTYRSVNPTADFLSPTTSVPTISVLLSTSDSPSTLPTSSLDRLNKRLQGELVVYPMVARNYIGQEHQISVTVRDLSGFLVPEVIVYLEIVSGPNMGVRSELKTDKEGAGLFSYKGTKEGVDIIRVWVDVEEYEDAFGRMKFEIKNEWIVS